MQKSGLPWVLPKKTLDLSNLTDAIGDAFGVNISACMKLLLNILA